jgi:peptidoglycan/xylan/chitin deacetylase (PgdA/CDA1 family)
MGASARQKTLAILGFHKIGPAPGGWDTWYYVPEGTFLGYLRHLREYGWRPLSLADLLSGLADPDRLPERGALITFDDGYRSLLHYGLPQLRECGFPAVVFVPTDFLGGRNDFDEGNEPDEAICGWDDLRELERHGVAVQSHGASHRGLSDLDAAGRMAELTRSKKILEAGLDRPVETFSYPFGDCGPDPELAGEPLAAAGYRAAFLYGGALQPFPPADPYRLERLTMGPDTDLAAELAGPEGGARP